MEGVETAANTQLGKTAALRRISQHSSFTSAKGIRILLTCPLIDWAPVYKTNLLFMLSSHFEGLFRRTQLMEGLVPA